MGYANRGSLAYAHRVGDDCIRICLGLGSKGNVSYKTF